MFADRKIARFVSQVREAILQVQRQRIIDFGSHAVLFEMGLQLVTPGSPDYKLVVNMPRLVGLCLRRDHRQFVFGQHPAVTFGIRLPALCQTLTELTLPSIKDETDQLQVLISKMRRNLEDSSGQQRANQSQSPGQQQSQARLN